MKLLITQQVRYNLWANQQYVAFFEQHPGFLQTEVLSSFKTPELTLRHIHLAQIVWLARLKGTTFDVEQLNNMPFALSDLLESSTQLLHYTRQLNPLDWQQPVHYQNLMKQVFTQKRYEIILHVVNHGTYHRGQLSMMLKQLNAAHIPPTDLIHFYANEDVENI